MKDRKILMVGASGKIGMALAPALLAMGCQVFEHSSKDADLRKTADIRRLVAKARKELGGMDAVIDCSGIFRGGPIERLSEKDWDDMFAVNLRSKFFLAKEAAALLRKGKGPSIIFFADTYWRSPARNYVPYGVSKAGLVALTRGLAKEFAPKIRVNAIAPGIVDTGRKFCAADKNVIKRGLTGRPVPLRDIINAVIFLLMSGSVTGEVITVDGGRHV